MAKFEIAFKKVIINEGGYVNDPDDKGGETFMGITRKNYPKAIMWNIIDIYKTKYNSKTITNALKNNTIIVKCVRDIYKNEYWDKFKLDNCDSNALANEIFDIAVNMGISKAAKLVQRIFKLTETGKIDKELLDKLNHYDED